jgi:hypothetical protein
MAGRIGLVYRSIQDRRFVLRIPLFFVIRGGKKSVGFSSYVGGVLLVLPVRSRVCEPWNLLYLEGVSLDSQRRVLGFAF